MDTEQQLGHMIRLYKEVERENELLRAQNERLRADRKKAIDCAQRYADFVEDIATKNGLKLPPILERSNIEAEQDDSTWKRLFRRFFFARLWRGRNGEC